MIAPPVRVRPAGNAPRVTRNVGAGEPSADTDRDTGIATANGPNTAETAVGATPAETLTVKAVAADPTEFVAVIVKVYRPAVVGVPVIAPLPTSIDSPAGNVPVRARVGAGEPSAETDAVAAIPAVNVPNEPDTRVGVVVALAAATLPVNVAETKASLGSVAVIVKP